MICPKCGEEMDDRADYCKACGCDLKEYREEETSTLKMYGGDGDMHFDYKDMAPLKKSKSKKNRKNGVISVLLSVAMIVLVVVAGVYVYRSVHKTDYEKRVEQMVSMLNHRESGIDECGKALLPEFLWEKVDALLAAGCEDSGTDLEELKKNLNMRIHDAMRKLEEAYGSDFQIEYEIVGAKKLSDEELKSLEGAWAQSSQLMDLFTDSAEMLKAQNKIKSYEAYMDLLQTMQGLTFTDGYELSIELTMTGLRDGTEQTQTEKVTMVETNGEWMLDFMSSMAEIQKAVFAN